MHPGCYALAHALLEGEAEGAVAAVAALVGQLLGGEGMLGSDGLAVETDEMTDAQRVDIGIVSGALTREIAAEIVAVGAKCLGKLGDGQVVLKVELCIHAVLL